MKVRHLVVGNGQVGSAIAEVLQRGFPETLARDVEEPVEPIEAEWLHVCFPYGPDFDAEVGRYVDAHGLPRVIVHSTVPVGTCDRWGWVHSPVRGRHPELARSLLVFAKLFAGGGNDAVEIAGDFSLCGMGAVYVVGPRAAITEAGKLWEMAQFASTVIVEKLVHEYCEERGLPFDVVYGVFGRTYNEGYQALDEERFVKPVLDHMPGPIGGHCVVPALDLLDDTFTRDLRAWVAYLNAE